MMRFAKIAKSGVDANEMEGLAAMSDLLEVCLADSEEFNRFMDHCTRDRLDGDQMLERVKAVVERLNQRPTQRSSDSPDGSNTTGTSTAAGSSSPVVRRLEQKGRPDVGLIVDEA